MTLQQILFFTIPPVILAFISSFIIYKKLDKNITIENIDRIFLSFSAGFLLGICISLILTLIFFKDFYNSVIQVIPDLSLLLALFAISIALLFTIDSIIDINKFQITVLTKLNEIKINRQVETTPSDSSSEIINKDYIPPFARDQHDFRKYNT